jgi:hypothetical protein
MARLFLHGKWIVPGGLSPKRARPDPANALAEAMIDTGE